MELNERIEMIASGWWSRELFKEYTEFDPWFSEDTEFLHLFKKWGEMRKKGKLIDESGISWIRFSQFCYHYEILPVKLQAVRLSMKPSDYTRLLWKMKEHDLIPESMANEALKESGFTGAMYQMIDRYDIEKNLPPLSPEESKSVWDTDVDSGFFNRLNASLKLKIRPLLRGRARCYDCLTGRALSNKGTVMLNFGHPLGVGYWSSESFVKRHRTLLKKYL